MFDDFMDELRRRQAKQRGETDQPETHSADEPAPDSGSEPADSRSSDGPTEDKPVMSNEDDSGGGADRDDEDRGGRGGGPGRPRGFGGGNYGGEMPEIHISRFWVGAGVVVLVLLVAVSLFLSLGVGLWTDSIWYQSVGYADVFWTRIGSQVGLFVLGAVGSFAFLWLNVWLTGRFIPKGQMRRFSLDDFLERFNLDRYANQMGGGGFNPPRRPTGRVSESVAMPDVARPVFWVILGIAVLIALGLGGLMASSWTTVQLFAHRVPFTQNDPTFGLNVGFFVFELPFYRLIQGFANTILLVSIMLVGVRYLVAVISGASMPTVARAHVGLLVALFLITIAIGFQLDRYSLVYSGQSGIFQGVSYTDANAKFLAINVMTILAAFAGTLFLVFAITRWWVPLSLTILVWLGAYVALVFAYPLITQRISVDPNQQGQETPYINANIAMTRFGFNLSNWSAPIAYTPGASIDQSALTNEQSTIQNLRLWDYRPLGPTLNNMQLIRNYYSFGDVDTDRYLFTSPASCAPNPAPCVRQVMLAGRELDPSKVANLNNGNSSWVNQHLIYTHGIGLAMLPVNEVVRSSTGQSANPLLVIQNVPPASSPGAPVVSEGRIYFGTQASDYVIVGGSTQEFDYPSSTGTTGDAYNNWTGTTGIKLDTPLTKLLFAIRFGDLNLMISNQVSGNSQLLMRRSIQERVAAIAPYLRYDKDPYLVVNSSGRLDYILDAYTTSTSLPDANTFDPGSDSSVSGLAGDSFNYIRNSVKVVMDAYDGSLTFYVADPTDPIIQAWEGVFPTVYHPMSEMPSDLQAHLRYPEDIFNAQTTVFEKYHVTDSNVFYQGNDVWQVARNSGTNGSNGPAQLPLEAYYVEMQAPGATDVQSSEFLLLQPMVLSGRPNMIAWVAAHNDPTSYGQVSVYDFPRDSTIYGPAQMSALIMQNPIISQQLTLWSQQGSTVTMGNLLVVPLQKSIMYVQPVYMASNTNPLPVLQRVIVATPSQIVWGDTLTDALSSLVSGGGQAPGASPAPGTSPGATPAPGATSTPGAVPSAGPSLPVNATAQQLIAAANQHYVLAQQALRNGDLATYQKEMNTVGQILAQLQSLLGTPAP